MEFRDFDEAARWIRDQRVQMIDLKFCDLWGRWHHVTLPAKQFTPKLLDRGVGFDGSAVGFKSVKSGDMLLVPDLGAVFDPFLTKGCSMDRMLYITCSLTDTFTIPGESPFKKTPPHFA